MLDSSIIRGPSGDNPGSDLFDREYLLRLKVATQVVLAETRVKLREAESEEITQICAAFDLIRRGASPSRDPS